MSGICSVIQKTVCLIWSEEVMVNESSVFDTSYFTHHCSTIPNLQSQYYAEPLCCFHALKTQRKTRGKVDIVEMFGGKQGIAKIAIRRNLSMGRNWDLETGIDLTNKDHIAAFKDYVVSVQPFIILAGPPCTALGGWSYLNRIKHPETWLPTRHIAEALAELTAWACLLQLKSSRHFLIENPVPSDLWNLPCWLPVKAHACVVFAIFDQCMMGQCDPDGIPTRKATGLLASHDILVQDFHVRCDGSHVHVSLEGSVRGISRCRYAQTWPRRMLECICKAVKKLMNQDQSCMDTLLAFPVIEPLRCAGCRAHAVRTDIRHSRIPNECRFTADTGIEWGCPACRRHLPSTHLGHMLDSGDCQWSIARRRARGGVRVVADAPPAEGVATALAPEPMPAALRNPRVLEQRRPESEELTVEPPPSVGTLKWQPVTDEDLLEYLKRYAITDGWKFIRGQHWIVESQVRNLRTCEPRHDSKKWNHRSSYGFFHESPHPNGNWWMLEFQAEFTAPAYPHTRARFGFECPVLVQVFSCQDEHKIIPEVAPPLASASSSSQAPRAPVQLHPADADEDPPPPVEPQHDADIQPEWASFDMGTALRALKSSNERVVLRALRRLHVRWYHCSTAKMRSLLLAAGVSADTVKLIAAVVDTCRICRSWKRPSASPATSVSLATRFNERIELDLMFYKTWIILHLICCATRFSVTSCIPDRSTETILTAITQCWFRLFGPPTEIVTDQEGAMTSESAMAWAEHWHCALRFVPKGSHAHTVERHHEILRDTLHKVEDQCKLEGLVVNKEHVLSEATFAKNAFVQVQGQSPYTAVLGRTPNLLLEVEGNTSSAVLDTAGNIAGVN